MDDEFQMGKVIYVSFQCKAEGCATPALTRGYCRAHYKRLRKSGELRMNTEVLAERGRKQDHPHYHRWTKMHSAKNLAPVWDDFWRFVDDVGDARGRTKMLRIDRSKPMGPDNFYWAEKLVGERKNAYHREWYKNSPNSRDKRYQKAYGIGVAEYDVLLAAQDGKCAICDESETKLVRRGTNEDLRRLAVDHDHTTGAVRGLLCGNCNTALGAFGDDETKLRRAIAYLERHRPSKAA